jgi:TRAP-type C4-dicarboxylate transport system permease large subunit
MIACSLSARHFGYKPEHAKRASIKEIVKAIIDGIWALIFPIMLIVLIRFGIMSPSESAHLP